MHYNCSLNEVNFSFNDPNFLINAKPEEYPSFKYKKKKHLQLKNNWRSSAKNDGLNVVSECYFNFKQLTWPYQLGSFFLIFERNPRTEDNNKEHFWERKKLVKGNENWITFSFQDHFFLDKNSEQKRINYTHPLKLHFQDMLMHRIKNNLTLIYLT